MGEAERVVSKEAPRAHATPSGSETRPKCTATAFCCCASFFERIPAM